MCYYGSKYLDIIRLGKFTENFPTNEIIGTPIRFEKLPVREIPQSVYELVAYTLG